ncbi:hypothetical protein [Conexibacter sp. W3-3-2]|uniref:hypothetical protein n=1 Tax=Conexibacter sp. W3-3-2 TaxID=2675227 RepID=UPI0018ABB92C|nr:hypothetical protein [Conexibacter sp. W3-3-2]
MSLGRRGVSQTMVLYLVAGLASAWFLRQVPPASWLVGEISWWLWMPAVVGSFTAAAAVKPNGLRMHEFLPAILGAAVSPRCHLGWEPAAELEGTWTAEDLPLLGDGSPGGEEIRYRGPGRVRIAGEVTRTGDELVVRAGGQGGQTVVVDAGQTVRITVDRGE